MEKKVFCFVTLTFNHQDYIIEHLESIKFLVFHYGQNTLIDLVIADDGSKDQTLNLVHFWLIHNKSLFQNVTIIGDGVNRGTCHNYTETWSHIKTPYFKVLAGDDVYSNENLIDDLFSISPQEFIQGLPLYLINGQIGISWREIFHLFANKWIYKSSSFLKRLTEINLINTPALAYSRTFLENPLIFDFIRNHQVVEDFAFMAKIAELYPQSQIRYVNKVYVYYRRTPGSTYIIKNNLFIKDKVRIFEHLIAIQTSFYEKLILKNRLWCFTNSNKFYRAFANLSYFRYFIKVMIQLPRITKDCFVFDRGLNLSRFIDHYSAIQIEAKRITKT